LTYDLPSRLADGLAAGRLDVALVPSIEYARSRNCRIVSDACVASDGAVRSVKLYGRVPPERIATLALDEGSRTSAALVRILLKEQFDIEPAVAPLPIGAAIESTAADAVLLIGDRGVQPANGRYAFVWDLGEQWTEWTGLPFVFAMWIARADADFSAGELRELEAGLAAARDDGLARLAEIARGEASALGIGESACWHYLRDNLHFQLGERERQGMQKFFDLAATHGLIPAEGERVG
jgi:chorismate dehydratase